MGIFKRDNSGTKITAVYSFLAATVPLIKGMEEQIFPFAWDQLCQTHSEFKKLYDSVERENTKHVRGSGMSATHKDFAGAFTSWLRTLDIHIGNFEPLIEKRVFVFGGDAQNPQDGSSFKWSVFVYFEMES